MNLETRPGFYVDYLVKAIEPQSSPVAITALSRCHCSLMIAYYKAIDNWAQVASCLLLCTKYKQNIANKRKQPRSWKATLKKNDVHSYPASSWQSTFSKTYLMFTTTRRLGKE